MANVRINYPQGGDTVYGGGFFSWGHYDPTYFTGVVSGTWTLVDAVTSGAVANGNCIIGHPQPCNWTAQLENITCPDNVKLTVTITDNLNHSSSDNVTFALGGLLTVPFVGGKKKE